MAPSPDGCTVVELRQYLMRPGGRDRLVDLFEREFVEPQEALGIRVIGTFRDLDRPDRFVWLRGFSGMDSRREALAAFYGGPVWKAHREAANATMIDSDDVLLLQPATADTGFDRPAAGGGEGLIAAHLWRPSDGDDAALAARLTLPALARFIIEPAENTFPALPVRVGERIVVWFSAHADEAALAEAAPAVAEAADRFGVTEARTLRLQPTARSRLRA